MNIQRVAQLRISPLHIQQGLFLMLALLVTLIAIQQYQRWDQTSQAAQASQQFLHSSTVSYRSVSSPVVKEASSSLRPVDGIVSVDEVAPQQKWVF
ncbi:hypothetical protein [Pseudomonas syringae]|uniref:Uncharacterized protein n=2 Tax=Pseudomonas syringae group TaxID=136849 RepID=A0A9Q4FIC8_PSESX|nr:hypothetical protein [Pseudomonas syringae]KTB54516.1 hypothetical protein AO067_02710 [Pseudomonas viridiflava ICMP 13104]KTB79806.1 hypothetical protein AO070_20875 [Pseudomonas syringae pv. syringae PD2766]MCF5467565.1 hypothetical protein [Pseudomonas syringae]MCF5474106.1 hypothetical protein [Pseudomonas syringae]MCF5481164.1 hypothetical protein [Pseudomonas syringae]